MKWKKRGLAVVGALQLLDARKATAVVVGSRNNPKGAALVVPAESDPDSVETLPLHQCLHLLRAQHVIDILCMQERVFGEAGLPSPFDEE